MQLSTAAGSSSPVGLAFFSLGSGAGRGENAEKTTQHHLRVTSRAIGACSCSGTHAAVHGEQTPHRYRRRGRRACTLWTGAVTRADRSSVAASESVCTGNSPPPIRRGVQTPRGQMLARRPLIAMLQLGKIWDCSSRLRVSDDHHGGLADSNNWTLRVISKAQSTVSNRRMQTTWLRKPLKHVDFSIAMNHG